MKKLLAAALLFVSMAAISLRGETIPADKINIYRLKDIISEDYGCKIDEDGDLQINGEYKFFVRIIPDVKMICIFTNFKPEDDRTVAETRRLANKFNSDKRLLRISVDDEGTSTCDYYMVYNGGLNTTNFKETVEWMDTIIEGWAELLAGYDEK